MTIHQIPGTQANHIRCGATMHELSRRGRAAIANAMLIAGLAFTAHAGAQDFPASISNTVNVTGPDSSVASATDTDTLINLADLEVLKVADNANPTVGGPIVFTITVTNNGPAPALAVVVNDLLPAGYAFVGSTPSVGTYSSGTGEWAVGTLANNESATLDIQATVNPAGPYTNTATGSTTTPDPTPGNNSGEVTPDPVGAQLTLTKVASAASFVVGVQATYELSVENTGTTATTVASTITDVIPTGLTIGTLPAGCVAASQTVTCTVAAGLTPTNSASFLIPVTPTLAAGASVTNTASVSGGGDPACPAAARCTASAGPTAVNAAQLTLSKVASAASFVVGVPATYELSVENTGTAATTAISTITDVIPTGLTIGTLPAGCVAASQTVTCTVPAGLTPTNSASFLIPVTPTLAAGASVTNTASVSGGGDPTCPAAARCTASAGPTAVNAPQLTLTKVASAGAFTVGTPATYTLQVSNNGTAATTAISTITDVIPTGLTIGTLPAGCLAAGQTVTCTVPLGLAPPNSVSFIIPVTPTEAALPSVTNTASVSGGGDPTCPAAARCVSSTGAIPVTGSPELTVDKIAGVPTGATAGSTIEYSFEATNSGNVTITNLQVVDALLDAPAVCPLTTLAPGISTICTGTHTITQAEIDAGTVDNSATVTGTAPGGGTIPSLPDTTSTSIAANPSVTIAKSALTATYSGIGEVIDFEYLVTNTGNVTINSLSVSDDRIAVVTCPVTTLAPLDFTTCTGSYTVVAADLLGSPGTVTNIATPSATPVRGVLPVVSDSVTITESSNPINAVADPVGPVNGLTGGTGVINVLDNDTLGGPPVNPADITLVPVTSGPLTVNADGTLDVAPNTPAGTYTIVYEICEVANPTNCSSATVTVTVAPAPIVANNESAGPVIGLSGGTAVIDVLVNDTLNGAPVNPAEITLVPVTSGPLTVNADGTVDVAPNTPAGLYTIVYEICEVLNPLNCDEATVTVAVAGAPVIATDDVTDPVDGTTGAVGLINVLDNDTYDSVAVDPANITLVPVTTGPLTVNADGTLDVAPGTPAGTYQIVYEICEALNPTNCDTATVTVTVSEAPIVAINDAAGPVNGTDGATGVVNVLDNDTLDGVPVTPADVTLVPVTTGPLTVNADGTLDVAPGTPAGTYTIVYEICETLNPTNCDTATVTVTVDAAPIVANEDSVVPVNGTDGGTGLVNVLDNDTLNGAPVNPANITLVPVTTGPLTVNADGTLDVAPNTPAGTYTIVYEICEVLNPANCDTASVTVTVEPAPIVANEDSAGPVNGTDGGAGVVNVLDNDTLDGAPVNPADVTLVPVTTGPLTVNADGTVDVAPGTPAGTYTVVYEICEVLNPANCDTGTVTVTVDAAPIVANEDSAGPVNGVDGGTGVVNVLDNDTLDGVPVNPADVTLVPVTTGPLTVNADGTVDVAPGTPAGTYTLVYEICEVLNPTNCDTGTVTVTVDAAPIVANEDSAGPVNGADGGTGVVNVLDNDTLDGVPVNPADVTLVPVTTGPLTVNADGTVDVAPGTPAGSYTVVYEICEVLNPTNCDTATVTVTVDAPPIDAVDDAGTLVGGGAGGVAVENVLVNDTVGGAPATLATVTLAQVSTSNPNVTLDPATGRISVAPGTPAGSYTVVYRICDVLNPGNCDTASVTVTVESGPLVAVEDVGSVSSGTVGGIAVPNVLVNDTIGGTPVSPSVVTLVQVGTTQPGVTLDTATGAVSVAPGTPVGTYVVTYQVCEIANPTNCSTASVTVVVNPGLIVAVADSGSIADGGAGGIAVSNVLVNDTLNGAPVSLATVTLTPLSSSHPNLTLDPATGRIVVAPGIPGGVYTVTYRICEILNPTNCSDATVTVTIGAGDIAPIAVNDDVAGDEGSPISGDAAGNDTAGNISSTYTALTQPANGTVVMNPNGSFTYTPNPGYVGPDFFTYQVCDADGDCASARVDLRVQPQEGKLRLQKAVSAREVKAGALVSYTLTVTNLGQLPVVGAQIVDVPPRGFAFVPGSVTVVDTDNLAVTTGTGPISFAGIDVPVGGTATVRYLLRAGAGLLPGEYINEATVYQFGIAVSNAATASVVTGGGLDPDFEQTRIWGKVFDDQNGDGWQDEGERGIPGVRLATVEGLVSETDAQGRFHIEGLVVSNQMRGQNFVVKVDTSTLPEGIEFTTANPLMRRITAGVPTRFDFGVRMPKAPAPTGVVELDLGTVVFAPGSREIAQEYRGVIGQMVEQLRGHAEGEVSIQTIAGEEALAFDRAVAVRQELLAQMGEPAAAKLRIDVVQADQSRLASVGEGVKLGSVLFDTDRDTLRAGHEALLDAVAREVGSPTCGCTVVLTGHADVRGNASYNQALSLRRAQVVREAIEARMTPDQRARLRVETEGAAAPGAGK